MKNTLIPTAGQQRSGAAATLLSLDVVTPFYSRMGVPAPEPPRFLQVVRECIVDNRKEFEHSPNRIPDIGERIQESLTRNFDSAAARAYDWWVKNIFVYSAEDFELFSDWYMVLALSRRDESRWSALNLPDPLSQEARIRLERILDRTELHNLADQVKARPLSPWDIEMYTLHGFDDDENDFYSWVLETVKKRLFVHYFTWLEKELTNEERAAFLACADELRRRIETTSHSPSLPDPLIVIEPYANRI